MRPWNLGRKQEIGRTIHVVQARELPPFMRLIPYLRVLYSLTEYILTSEQSLKLGPCDESMVAIDE